MSSVQDHGSGPATLKYGMKINLCAKSPVGVDPKINYYLTNYEKHGLVALHDTAPLTFQIVATSATSQDVCYGDRVVLVDEHGLVMNGQDTNTWGKGYISLKPRSVSGELHFMFTRPSQPLMVKSPILLSDIQQGNKVQLHAIKGKGSSQQNLDPLVNASTRHAVTIERRSNSSCQGGYLRFGGHGSGQIVGFDVRVVAQPQPPLIQNAPTPSAYGQSIQSTTHGSSAGGPLSVTSAGGQNTGNNNNNNNNPDDGEEADVDNNNFQLKNNADNANPPRPFEIDAYDIMQEVKPLRYGDKIRLVAKSPYYPDGGPVGLYQKHELIGVAPVIKGGKPIEEGDNNYDNEFIVSEYIICATGTANTGDIVRYSQRCVLVDAKNGNAVWNCRDTDTWANGYIAEGPIVQNSVIPQPNTDGPQLISANFNHITQRGKLPSGQVHISFQPGDSSLYGYPIYNKDSNISIDVEDTHQKKGRLNSRLSVYKKKTSMLCGGYLICLPNAGKPVTFTVDRVYAVPIQRGMTPFMKKLHASLPASQLANNNNNINNNNPNNNNGQPEQITPVIPISTKHYRPSTQYAKARWYADRMKYVSIAVTFYLLYITIGFYTAYQAASANAAKLAESTAQVLAQTIATNATTDTIITNVTNAAQAIAVNASEEGIAIATDVIATEQPIALLFGLLEADSLKSYYYIKQIFYMLLTLLSAFLTLSYSNNAVAEHVNVQVLTANKDHSLAERQTAWRVKNGDYVEVVVERNTLAHLMEDAQSDGKKNDPNAWMIEAGLDIDNLIVPERYVNAEKGNAEKGRKRFIVTAKWRWVNQLDTILDRPHPLFRIIKQNTVQFFCGKDKKGNCAYYEAPKAANLPQLDKHGVTMDELLFHFVYITEYLYQRLDNRLDARCLSVVDLNGIGLSDFGGEVVKFVQAVAKVTQTHYPERSAGIICVNAGFAFRAIWSVVQGMMDPVTRSRTHIWGSNFIDQMAELVDIKQIPVQFGGKAGFVAAIPEKGPVLPASAIDEQFNGISVLPLSTEEQELFTICDTANKKWVDEHPGEKIPRPLLQ